MLSTKGVSIRRVGYRCFSNIGPTIVFLWYLLIFSTKGWINVVLFLQTLLCLCIKVS